MSFTRWIQLLCSVVLVLLPAAIHYRNYKHHDRRTKLHKSITVALLTLWVISAIGIGWGLYKDFSHKGPAPAFQFYLNGLAVEEGACITIPVTNDTPDLTFTVRNSGDWPADGCQLSIGLPHGLRIVKSEGWLSGGALESWGTSLKPADDNVFHVEATRAIGTNFFLFLPPLTVNLDGQRSRMTGQWLTAEAKNVQTVRFHYSVHFTNGVGQPHRGF